MSKIIVPRALTAAELIKLDQMETLLLSHFDAFGWSIHICQGASDGDSRTISFLTVTHQDAARISPYHLGFRIPCDPRRRIEVCVTCGPVPVMPLQQFIPLL